MARWASLIDRRKAEHPVLLIDTGGFSNPVLSKEADLEDDYFFEAMRLMRYDAAGIGPGEVRFGRARLLERASSARLDLLTANVRDRRSGNLLGKPWKIAHVGGRRTLFGRSGGVRVGLFAVTLPLFIHEIDPVVSEYYEVLDPRMAALEAVSALRGKDCDIIIGISYQGWTKSVALATEVPGIDVVVNGRRSHVSAHGERHGGALVVDTGNSLFSLTEISAVWRDGEPVVRVNEAGGEAREMPARRDLRELNERYEAEQRARRLEQVRGQ